MSGWIWGCCLDDVRYAVVGIYRDRSVSGWRATRQRPCPFGALVQQCCTVLCCAALLRSAECGSNEFRAWRKQVRSTRMHPFRHTFSPRLLTSPSPNLLLISNFCTRASHLFTQALITSYAAASPLLGLSDHRCEGELQTVTQIELEAAMSTGARLTTAAFGWSAVSC